MIDLCRANKRDSHELKDTESKDLMVVDAVATTTKKWTLRPKQRAPSEQTPPKECAYCGAVHSKEYFPAYGKNCKACSKVGHFAAVCRSKKKKTQRKVDAVEGRGEDIEYVYIPSIEMKPRMIVLMKACLN